MVAAEMTELLQRVARGDKNAEAELLPQIYRELHQIARAYLRNERPEHTLQASALVNEVYVRVFAKPDAEWKNRSHFFGMAARTMRSILVDYARGRKAVKRDGGVRILMEEGLTISPEQCDLVAALDEALERLAKIAPRAARVVELRLFSGLSEEEIADILNLSVRTVRRDWKMARAWLYEDLSQ